MANNFYLYTLQMGILQVESERFSSFFNLGKGNHD